MHPDKLVIGLVGPAGTGKTTLARLMISFSERENGPKIARIGSGDIVGATLMQYGIEPTRQHLQDLGIFLQSLKDGAIATAIFNAIKAAPEPVVIFDCVRTLNDYRTLQQFPHHTLVYVATADDRLRFDRMRQRSEKGEGGKSDAEFRQAEGHAIERWVYSLCDQADHIINHNHNNLDDFSLQVHELMIQLGVLAL